MNMLKTTTLSAIASGLLVLGLGSSPVSHASIQTTLSASGACMASSGPGADNFYFSALRAQNTAAVSHYIICDLPLTRRVSGADPTFVGVHFYNPLGSIRTVDCVLVASHGGVAGMTTTFSFSTDVDPGGVDDYGAVSGVDIPTNVNTIDHMALSCLVPASVGVSTIEITMPGNIPA